MVSAADGSDVTTGTPTVYVTGDGGTQATGTGTAAHEGNGCWSYAPTQAETNYNHAAYTMKLATAVTQTVNVYTRPANFGALQIPADGRVQVDVRELNGSDTDGNNAVLSLKGIDIQADDGTIPLFISAGGTCGQNAVVIQSARDGYDTLVVQKIGGAVTGRAIAIVGAYDETVEVTNANGYDALKLVASGAGRAVTLDGGTYAMYATGDRAVRLQGKATASHGHALELLAGAVANAVGLTVKGPTALAGKAVEVQTDEGPAIDVDADNGSAVKLASTNGPTVDVDANNASAFDIDSSGFCFDLDSTAADAVNISTTDGWAVKLFGTDGGVEVSAATDMDAVRLIAAGTGTAFNMNSATGKDIDAKEIDAIDTAVGALDTKLGTPAGASVSADIAAVKGDTAAIVAKLPAGTIGDATAANQATIIAGIGALQTDTANLLAGQVTLSGEHAALNAQNVAILADTAVIVAKLPSGTISDFDETTDAVFLSAASLTAVEGKVSDQLDAAIAEPSVGVPGTTASIRLILSWVWMGLRNKGITDSVGNVKKWHNSAGAVLAKKPVTDDGSVFTEDEMVAP